MKLKFFFCQFPNPWALRVSGMGGYTSKCEKKSKSLHPTEDVYFYKKTLCRWIQECKTEQYNQQSITLGTLFILATVTNNLELCTQAYLHRDDSAVMPLLYVSLTRNSPNDL